MPATLDKKSTLERRALSDEAGTDRQPRRAPSIAHRTIIIEADDLGLLYAFNEGIRSAYREGVLSSACLRANGYAFDHAVDDVIPSCTGLGIGIHLCLNEAGCVAPAGTVSLLLDKGNRLRGGYRWIAKLARTSVGRVQIECELRAQIEKVIARGLRVDHLNSHQHVHMIPSVFRITCRLAREYGIACVRLSREPAYSAGSWPARLQPLLNTNALKHVLLNRFARVNAPLAAELGIHTTDHFVGVNYTGRMNLDTTIAGLRAADSGCVEVLLHPAIGPDPRDTCYPRPYLRRYVSAPQRATELETLRGGDLMEFLHRERWQVSHFAGWSRSILASTEGGDSDGSSRLRRLTRSVTTSNPPWVSSTFPDSRAFAELAVSVALPGQRALDVGTGTGIVAICLARAGVRVTATDVSAAAVRSAQANARRNGVQVTCLRSDLLTSVQDRFDLIAINPPYNFVRDTFPGNLAKNLLRRVPSVHRRSGTAMPRAVMTFRRQMMRRFFDQAATRLRPHGSVLVLAYRCEVDGFMECMPPGADVRLLNHPDLDVIRTVGMLIRLPDDPGTTRVDRVEG